MGHPASQRPKLRKASHGHAGFRWWNWLSQKCEIGQYTSTCSASSGNANTYRRCPCTVAQQCLACLPGKYKGAGNSRCMECDSGFVAESFGQKPAVSVKLGNTPTTLHTACISCPFGTESDAESSSLNDCTCKDGHIKDGDKTDGSCKACSADTYQDEEICQDCPTGKTSSPGSYDISHCKCKSGFAPSEFSDECVCDPGYEGSGGTCTPCGQGTKKAEAGNAVCTQCDPGTVAKTSGATSCELCQANTYSNSTTTCAPCPPNSESNEGSSAKTDCTCKDGFPGPSGGPCVGCSLGQFAPPGSQTCGPCDAGTYRNDASWATCEPCEAGTYATGGASTCLSCPDHATSAEQSTSEEACECNAGYFLQNDACTQCLRGTFKDVTGNEACTSCPAGFAAKDLGMTACTDCS